MGRRLLTVSWEYPPVVEGGLGRHVGHLSEQLAARGIEVHVLTRDRDGIPAKQTRAGVHVHRVPTPVAPTDLDGFLAWVERMDADLLAAGQPLARRIGPDLVHGHDWLVAPAATALADAARVPYVTTIHATEHGRHDGRVEQPPQSAVHAVERRMARRADAVITCSREMRRQVVDLFGLDPARVTAIPNGIDRDALAPPAPAEVAAVRARFARPGERLVLLVGRLVYEKGFQLAIEALPDLRRRVHGGVRMVVAGEGPHRGELEAQVVRLGLADHVRFAGWVADDELRSLYAGADLCVVPSLYEPFGLVALEAMASGCPCLVADTGGLREVVPTADVGLRFPARDAGALARTAARMLADPDLRGRLAARAVVHADTFGWPAAAARTAAVYEALLTAGRPAPESRRGDSNP